MTAAAAAAADTTTILHVERKHHAQYCTNGQFMQPARYSIFQLGIFSSPSAACSIHFSLSFFSIIFLDYVF